jgi:hypothetical protein
LASGDDRGALSGFVTDHCRFPPPWSVDEPNLKLDRHCSIVRDANGHALTYVYFDDERSSTAAPIGSPEG